MNMQPLFSTKERELILNYLLDHADLPINMNQIAREIGVSPSQVHKYVSILRQCKLVEGSEVLDTPLLNTLRLIKNLNIIDEFGVVKKIRKAIPSAKGIGLYGSWAGGRNTRQSDLDLWVKTDIEVSDLEIAKISRTISEGLRAEVELLIATPRKIDFLQKKAESVYYTLFNSMLLWGEPL